jgi:starch synthase
MSKLRILFTTTQINPFLKITDAADFIRLLPEGLQQKGHEIRILMPKFGVINERRHRLHEVVRLSGINIRVGNKERPLTIKVATIPDVRLQVYFLDNQDYFQRRSVLVDSNNDCHADNDERSIFFCKGVIETVRKLGWTPNIIHCHGWMTALIPFYLKTHYKEDPMFRHSKVVFTVYNNEIDHPLPDNFIDKARLDGMQADTLALFLKSKSYLGLAQGGITMADAVTKGDMVINSWLEEYLNSGNGFNFHANIGNDQHSCVESYNMLYESILN